MPISEEMQNRILLAVTLVAAITIQISIAVSQTFLGIGIALTLIFRRRLPFPRIWVPLICLFVWTLAAVLVSPDPWGGRSQIRKFFVFLFIPLVYGEFVRKFSNARWLLLGWIGAATLSACLGLGQFVYKYHAAHRAGQDFYVTYLARRITGFDGHWMTFGALILAALSLVFSHLFFAAKRFPAFVYATSVVLLAAILLGWTRSIWLATIPSLLYLVWFWRPKYVFLVPVLALLAVVVSPPATRERMISLVHPHGDTDSNRHRIVTFRTGLQMIKAHPVFGIGPEEIGREFNSYVPADVRRPLPVGYYGHLHNIYVQYAAERGLPGLFCVLWLIGLAVWDCLRAALERQGKRSSELAVLHGFIALTIGILVGGAFEYNLGDSEVLMMFVSALALAYAAAHQKHTPEQA